MSLSVWNLGFPLPKLQIQTINSTTEKLTDGWLVLLEGLHTVLISLASVCPAGIDPNHQNLSCPLDSIACTSHIWGLHKIGQQSPKRRGGFLRIPFKHRKLELLLKEWWTKWQDRFVNKQEEKKMEKKNATNRMWLCVLGPCLHIEKKGNVSNLKRGNLRVLIEPLKGVTGEHIKPSRTSLRASNLQSWHRLRTSKNEASIWIKSTSQRGPLEKGTPRKGAT